MNVQISSSSVINSGMSTRSCMRPNKRTRKQISKSKVEPKWNSKDLRTVEQKSVETFNEFIVWMNDEIHYKLRRKLRELETT